MDLIVMTKIIKIIHSSKEISIYRNLRFTRILYKILICLTVSLHIVS